MSSFEKVRMDYCARVFEREAGRKEILEKKAQFYLSLVSLALGAVFLKLEFLEDIATLLSREGTPLLAANVILAAAVVTGAGLIYALVAAR